MKTTRPKYLPAFATALTASLLTACVSTPKEAGFVSLFDGKSLNGWRLLGKKGDGYGVKDGVIYCARAEVETCSRKRNTRISSCDWSSNWSLAQTTVSAF